MKLEERRRLHGLTVEQLASELAKAESDLLRFRFDIGLNKMTNPAGLHTTRKRIAVLKTLIRQHELLNETGLETMEQYKLYRGVERKSFREDRKAR